MLLKFEIIMGATDPVATYVAPFLIIITNCIKLYNKSLITPIVLLHPNNNIIIH